MQIQSYQGEHKIEYSTVNISELEGALRIDAKYYDPVYLRNEKLIEKKTFTFIKKLISNCDYGISIAMNTEVIGYKMLKMDDIIGILADDSNCKFADIPEKLFKKYRLMKGDILFNRVNSEEFVGRTGIYLLDGKHTFASYLIRIRTKEDYTNFYITIFLNSLYGKVTLNRVSRRSVNQANINAEEFKNLKIPVPSPAFQKQIENLVLTAYKEREKADTLYKEAENILLEELGLKNWKPKTKKIKIDGEEFEEEENISIRRLSECLKVNRFDAEYWLPVYDEIENLIKNYKGGWDILKNRFNQNKAKKEINKEKEFNYIEIGSINVSNGEIKPLKLKDFELPANAKLKLNLNDILISKVRTYRGAVTFIYKELDNLVGSGAFTVLQEKNVFNKETLFVLLKTKPYLTLSLKFNTGTSYPTLDDKDILNLPIPLLHQQAQSKISQKIQQSFKARRKSRELLEIAKRGVEIYIENDEQKGINYITKQLQDLN